jgi:uracil-DNA glycosylase family 4
MDSLFKQKLLTLRNPKTPVTFSEALLVDTSWLRKGPKAEKVSVPRAETFSEKVQVIESLERFAQEKAEDLGTHTFKIEGGEVHVKSEPSWGDSNGPHSIESLREDIKLEKNLQNLVLAKKIPSEVKAIFISEKFRTWDEVSSELKDGFINELLAGFPLKTAELFMRMIMAMKLDPSEVIIFPIEGSDESDFSRDAMEVAAFFKPEVIITLGAKATHKILKSNDRLSLVHGQFFNRKMGETTFQVVPLFHPSIIETNQNMKKTAWTDMQKIMKHLKKLP